MLNNLTHCFDSKNKLGKLLPAENSSGKKHKISLKLRRGDLFHLRSEVFSFAGKKSPNTVACISDFAASTVKPQYSNASQSFLLFLIGDLTP